MRRCGSQPATRRLSARFRKYERENGHASVELILERDWPITALLACSVEWACGAVDALRQYGRGVPRSVSVIGFDYSMARTTMTNLTRVCVDAVEVGRQLAKMAVAKTKVRQQELPEVIVPAVLVKRGTRRPFRANQGMVL